MGTETLHHWVFIGQCYEAWQQGIPPDQPQEHNTDAASQLVIPEV